MHFITYFLLINLLFAHCSAQKIHLVIACHGNMDLTPHLSLENFRRFYHDDIIGSVYEKNVQCLRNNTFFFLHHPMQLLGLHLIDPVLKKNHTAGLFAYVHHALSMPCKEAYCYYTFGWSGLQSPKARLAEAQLLYQRLHQEVIFWNKQGYTTKITLIGYSHGGNVALNAAAYFSKNDGWHVDTLVLLGVPIVPESRMYALSDLFKEIYNFYSLADRVQPLDCLAKNRIFSARRLGNFISSCKIYDIQLRIKRSYMHTALYHPLQRAIKKNDPSHVEWWSFGWTAGYRNSFALYPLPVSVFTPLFIHALKKSQVVSQHIIIDLHAYKNIFYVHDNYHCNIFNFVDSSKLNTIKKCAAYVQPDNYSKLLFKQHIHNVVQ